MLRLDLCNYRYAYIIVKGRINVIGTNNANKRNRNLNFAPFCLIMLGLDHAYQKSVKHS